jgi:hypothetical protein
MDGALEAAVRQARLQAKAAADAVPLELVHEARSFAKAAILRSKKAVAASSQVNTVVDQVIYGLPISVLFVCRQSQRRN